MPMRRRQEGTSLIPSNLHQPEDCRAVSEVLSRVGDKWTVLVVGTLGDGPKRFNELRRALGSISQRMLTLTLRALERDGLVDAHRLPDHSAARRLRTDAARTFIAEPVSSLSLWARQNRSAIETARRQFDSAEHR